MLPFGKAIDEEEYCSHLFRFPNGYMAPLYRTQKKQMLPLLAQNGYTYLDWNCLTNDSMQKYTNAELLQFLKTTAQNKNTLVILMHDTKDVNDSSLVLKDCIHYLKSQGYVFDNFRKFFE